jgi:hypothetical protein
MFSSKGNNGYWMKNKWPLWKGDSQQRQDFLNYKQVVKLPQKLIIANCINIISIFIFILLCLNTFTYR